MKRVRLGKTDMYVNAIGLGCMGLSHASGVPTPKDEAVEILRKAHEMGYDFYDTAECYTGINPDGSTAYNEEVVGEAVKPFRKDIILCTKFGVKHMGDHLEFDSSPETIRKSLEGSLKKLQTDYVDIYYQHRIDPKVEPEVVAGVMKELMEEGKIKAWGISETNEEYLRRAHAVCPVTVIENRYSMMARWHENLMHVCKELGITYVAFSPLANGGRLLRADLFKIAKKFPRVQSHHVDREPPAFRRATARVVSGNAVLERVVDDRADDALGRLDFVSENERAGVGAASRGEALHVGARGAKALFHRVDELRALHGVVFKKTHRHVVDGRELRRFVLLGGRFGAIAREARATRKQNTCREKTDRRSEGVNHCPVPH